MTQLDAILSELNDALRTADFEQIATITSRLEVAPIPRDHASLMRAARAAKENIVILDAAANGLRAARRRIEELRKGRRLTTYDKAGLKQDHPAGPARSSRV